MPSASTPFFPKALRRPGMELRELEARQFFERLEQLVPLGRMTPFLGAACSATGGKLEPRAAERNDILHQIELLRLPRAPGDIELTVREMRYARAVAEKYGAIPNGGSQPVGQGSPDRHADCPLPDLQRATIRLGAFAEELVGRVFVAREIGLTDLRNCWVTIESQSAEGQALLQLLLDLVACARILDQRRCMHGPREALGEVGILAQLRVLALEIFPQNQRTACKTAEQLGLDEALLHELHVSGLLHYPLGDVVHLALSHLEWITALLWHTLRFDARFYPGSSELAFQLSLRGSLFVPPFRPELGQAAEVTLSGTDQEAATLLDGWFKYYEKQGDAKPGKLHVAIAAYLRHIEARRTEQLVGPAADAHEDVIDSWPVVLTTNYDRELERGLLLRPGPIHVLVPGSAVIAPSPGGQNARSSAGARTRVWFCHTLNSTNGIDNPSVSLLEPSLFNKQSKEAARLGDLMKNPVIVKLHGTTGYPLPNLISVMRDNCATVYTDLSHDLILRESDFLESMLTFPSDHILHEIEDRLFQGSNVRNRMVCFLGHSVSDWNIRLRVYERVRKYNPSEHRMQLVAVNRRIDRYKAQIFAPLECEVARQDLSAFVSVLSRVQGVRQIFEEMWGTA